MRRSIAEFSKGAWVSNFSGTINRMTAFAPPVCRQYPTTSWPSSGVPPPQRYSEIWPDVLADHHLTKGDLNAVVWEMKKAGTIEVQGSTRRQRTPRDDQLVSLPARLST